MIRATEPPIGKPLTGIRVLITRAREQAEALAKPLREQGADVIAIPTIEIRPPQSYGPIDRALMKIQTYDWLILTSTNGVTALRRRMQKLHLDTRLLQGLSISAIGPATRKEVEMLGLRVSVMPQEYVAESVVDALAARVKGQRVLLVRAKVARDVIPQQLRRSGAEVDVVEAYETAAPASSRERLWVALQAGERPDYVTFTSSSTVKNFLALLPKNVSLKELLNGIHLVSIGPVTSSSLREAGLLPSIEAREYTMEGVVAAIVEWETKARKKAEA